jgi:hypothetical protein
MIAATAPGSTLIDNPIDVGFERCALCIRLGEHRVGADLSFVRLLTAAARAPVSIGIHDATCARLQPRMRGRRAGIRDLTQLTLSGNRVSGSRACSACHGIFEEGVVSLVDQRWRSAFSSDLG